MPIGHLDSQNNITALAAGGQSGATPLRSQAINRVTTVATAADSVMLPGAVNGKILFVINATANSMNVFPRSGETINALAANTALAVAAGKSAGFICSTNGAWYCLLSA